MRKPDQRRGFTLLEAIIAMAILSLSMMGIFSLNSGAVNSHAYGKKLTVATLLARSKMTDIEQKLYDEGFQLDDDEQSGDFSDEGFSQFKWRAKIVAPKTDGLPPEKLLGALFNVPLGGDGKSGDSSSGLASLFTGAMGGAAAGAAGQSGGASGAGAALMGPAMGMIQGQFNQMIQSIAQAVREVHLTVSWKHANQTETIDMVTHIVSFGPGTDRNGGGPQIQDPMAAAAAAMGAGGGLPSGTPINPSGSPFPTGSGLPGGGFPGGGLNMGNLMNQKGARPAQLFSPGPR